jgi:hypothetical protein
MTQAPTSLTHWGGFSVDIESGDIASVAPLDGDTDPSPLLGQPARLDSAFLAHRHTGSAARVAARQVGPEHAARRRRVRRRVLGRAHRTPGGRAAPCRRHVRERGHLRRLVRLGQRRPASPRAEPGAQISQPSWRIYVFEALVQPRCHRRHHAARDGHPRQPVPAVHRVGGHRRAIFSASIDGFGYDDCTGHPKW